MLDWNRIRQAATQHDAAERAESVPHAAIPPTSNTPIPVRCTDCAQLWNRDCFRYGPILDATRSRCCTAFAALTAPRAPPPTSGGLPHFQWRYLRTSEAARRGVAALLAYPEPLGFDLEVAKRLEYAQHPQAGLDPHLSRIRLAQFGAGTEVYVFDLFDLDLASLAPLWDKPLVAHNAVYELKHLLALGVRPKSVDCTMLMANALDGTLPTLKALADSQLGWSLDKTEQVSDWAAPELADAQLRYAALDALAVYHLRPLLRQHLDERDRHRCYELMRDAQPAIAHLELAGCPFDRAAHQRLIAAWETQHSTAERELVQVCPGINPNSGQQLSVWLTTHLERDAEARWPRTPTGLLKTDADTLALFDGQPLAAPLIRFKTVDKLLSTCGARFAQHLSPATGRIHAGFRLGGTASGRMACRRPNLQNPPRDPAFRALFAAPVGSVLVVADYGQIELRVAALVSGDSAMLDAYRHGEDLHRKTAAAVLGIDPNRVTKSQRQMAKAVNFGLLYGQGAAGLARYAKSGYGVDMTELDAARARAAFFAAYPDLHRWQAQTIAVARRTLRVRTPAGRVRAFARDKFQPTEALNTPIQGGAAEVLLAALARLPPALEEFDARLVNVVHDELVVECRAECAVAVQQAVETVMTEGFLAIFREAADLLASLVEAQSGPNWAAAKG